MFLTHTQHVIMVLICGPETESLVARKALWETVLIFYHLSYGTEYIVRLLSKKISDLDRYSGLHFFFTMCTMCEYLNNVIVHLYNVNTSSYVN